MSNSSRQPRSTAGFQLSVVKEQRGQTAPIDPCGSVVPRLKTILTRRGFSSNTPCPHFPVRSAKCSIQVSYRRKSLRPYGPRHSPGSPDPGYKRTAFIRVDRFPSAVAPLRSYSDAILKDASGAAEPRFEIGSQNRETLRKSPRRSRSRRHLRQTTSPTSHANRAEERSRASTRRPPPAGVSGPRLQETAPRPASESSAFSAPSVGTLVLETHSSRASPPFVPSVPALDRLGDGGCFVAA